MLGGVMKVKPKTIEVINGKHYYAGDELPDTETKKTPKVEPKKIETKKKEVRSGISRQ